MTHILALSAAGAAAWTAWGAALGLLGFVLGRLTARPAADPNAPAIPAPTPERALAGPVQEPPTEGRPPTGAGW